MTPTLEVDLAALEQFTTQLTCTAMRIAAADVSRPKACSQSAVESSSLSARSEILVEALQTAYQSTSTAMTEIAAATRSAATVYRAAEQTLITELRGIR